MLEFSSAVSSRPSPYHLGVHNCMSNIGKLTHWPLVPEYCTAETWLIMDKIIEAITDLWQQCMQTTK